eukprot:5269288-Alexandrium_andersonii.AAC.1
MQCSAAQPSAAQHKSARACVAACAYESAHACSRHRHVARACVHGRTWHSCLREHAQTPNVHAHTYVHYTSVRKHVCIHSKRATPLF